MEGVVPPRDHGVAGIRLSIDVEGVGAKGAPPKPVQHCDSLSAGYVDPDVDGETWVRTIVGYAVAKDVILGFTDWSSQQESSR